MTAVQINSIPHDLRECDQWIVWKTITRNGKPTKVPFDPKSGQPASVSDRETWASFDAACTAFQTDQQWSGIGFVLTEDDDFAGTDLDRCIDDEGYIEPWAANILDTLNTYCEVSPSRRGIKALARGRLPEGRRRRGQIEMYDHERFFTITGEHVPDYPAAIHERGAELAAIHAAHLGERERHDDEPVSNGGSRLHDDDLLKRIRASEQATKFKQLWAGNFEGYDSQSEADLALCNILAFWTDRDAVAIDRLFRQSGLYREKWDRSSYRDTTMDEAISFVTETYRPDDGATFSVNGAGPISLGDFLAYLPEHKFIFIPTRALWPAASIDQRMGKVGKMKASTWLDRNQAVEQMIWAPGWDMVIEDHLIDQGGWIKRKGVKTFNLYRAPTIKPGNPNDAERWIDHVYRVYPSEAEHIISWLAHRVQHPDQKINHALILGGLQGVGKDTLLEPIRHAVGSWNFREASPVNLLETFNPFVQSVILRVSEARDLGDVNRYALYDHLKVYTASPPDVLTCNEKFIRQYTVLNVCGIIMTTNHKTDGIYLPSDDRRHFVAWSNATINNFEQDYWTDLWNWYHAGGNRNVTAYLAEYDLVDFDAKAPPPKTGAFWDIVDANRAPEDAELADALDRLSWPEAVTIAQLAVEAVGDFAEWLRDRKNRRQIPHRMEAAGYIPVRNDGAKDGLWKIKSKRQAVYAKVELTPRDRIAATGRLTDDQ